MRKIILFITAIVATTMLSAQTTVGLIGYFKLNGNTTNTGSANITATAVNTSYTTNNGGSPNGAIQFTGTTSSYVDFTDNGNMDFAGTSNFTISFSFFFNGSATSGLIDNCLNYGGWGVWFWQQVAGVWNIQFNYKNGSIGSPASTAFTVGTWHHVAVVRNNGTLSIYIDGAFRLSGAEGSATPSYPLNMIAGAFGYSGFSPPRYNPLNGKMDEIRFYNRALSASEIAALTSSALPLTLVDFNTHIVNNNAVLNWKTINETNTLSFDIERSIQGGNYTTIGSVASSNTPGTHQYDFTDNNISSLGVPVVYYRLKQKDIDGHFTYSRIVVLSIHNNRNIVLFYPNPVVNEANLTITVSRPEQVQTRIIDNAGRVVKHQQWNLQTGSTSLLVDVSGLAKGMYRLELKSETICESKQFIKQ